MIKETVLAQYVGNCCVHVHILHKTSIFFKFIQLPIFAMLLKTRFLIDIKARHTHVTFTGLFLILLAYVEYEKNARAVRSLLGFRTVNNTTNLIYAYYYPLVIMRLELIMLNWVV